MIAAALRQPPTLSLEAEGAMHLPGDTDARTLKAVEAALVEQPSNRAGVRLGAILALAELLAPDGPIGLIAADALGASGRPVRAILFDTSAAANWALVWHQNRTVAVRERREVPDYGTWTTKAGMQHVKPPAELLARMVTLRLHLDVLDADNAPLLYAPGSDRGRWNRCSGGAAWRGYVPGRARRRMAYSTLVLHASDAAARPRGRRVLQVDYSADELGGGLEWLGVRAARRRWWEATNGRNRPIVLKKSALGSGEMLA